MRQYNARTFARKVFIEMETRLIDDRTISSRKRIIRQTIDYLWCEKWCAILLRAFIKGLFLIWKVDKKDFHEKLTRWPRFQRPIECSISMKTGSTLFNLAEQIAEVSNIHHPNMFQKFFCNCKGIIFRDKEIQALRSYLLLRHLLLVVIFYP